MDNIEAQQLAANVVAEGTQRENNDIVTSEINQRSGNNNQSVQINNIIASYSNFSATSPATRGFLEILQRAGEQSRQRHNFNALFRSTRGRNCVKGSKVMRF